ncbi:uncharacterized protein EAE98_002943 [Botrytis deweyae]|uniref:Heterokaryon incompatibility domain-containing protein n=1 Tax=Botrytis deweyae TaxID=2478750 RepID=A0ABQ7IV78_9HELO|nr:uncharacterized protein EAE98_002943 [Botrytis deweyae]KAF7934898.1 hypothetical protein EAE98_002943 [Botrytis deweyae]
MNQPIDPFQYKELKHDLDEIRLLRLLPPISKDDVICCRLIHTALHRAPTYRALSYTWGAKISSESIIVNGKRLSASNNLIGALRRLRSWRENDESFLWVDAICIDQNNIPERNNQIAKMKTIFQNAQSVPVWIGSEKDNSSLAIRLAKKMNKASRNQVIKMLRDPSTQDQLMALITLFRRQYWWRIWVIQEVACAKEAIVLCGDESIPIMELCNTCDILKREEHLLLSIYLKSPSYVRTLTTGGPKSLQVSRDQVPDAVSSPLFELLLSHKSKKSSDPKDKVYALVGISNSRESFGKINYSLSIRRVYTHTARHIIQDSRRLDVICVNQRNQTTPDNDGLPSWVPNWTRPPQSRQPTIIGLQHSEPQFMASGDNYANVQFLQDGYVLRTTGVILGRVQKTGLSFRRELNSRDNNHRGLKVLQEWWSIVVSKRRPSLREQGAFCRTISCGNWTFNDHTEYAIRMKALATILSEQLPKLSFPLSSISAIEGTLDEKERLALLISACWTMNRRRFIVSDTGIIGLGPWNCSKNDLICILPGCRFPVILRKTDDHYILVGEAYIDGFMYGEGIRGVKNGLYDLETFEIH